MTFQLVDETGRSGSAAACAPIGDEILPLLNERNKNAPPRKVVVQRRVMVSGDRLTDAQPGLRSSRPASRS